MSDNKECSNFRQTGGNIRYNNKGAITGDRTSVVTSKVEFMGKLVSYSRRPIVQVYTEKFTTPIYISGPFS